MDPWVRQIPWRRAWQPTPVFLENPMDRRAWRATVPRVAKSQTQLKRLSTAQHTFLDTHIYKHTLHIFIHRCTYTDVHTSAHTHRSTHTGAHTEMYTQRSTHTDAHKQMHT